MSTLVVHLGLAQSEFTIDDGTVIVPVGSGSLATSICTDPPAPEELVNAIGLVIDHLDDVDRGLPMLAALDRVEVCGPGVDSLVAVEVGAPTPLPHDLTRDAAEEVFRTMATECRAERRLNPGLPEAQVHHILGVSCAVVALMRHFAIDQVCAVPEPVGAP